MTISLLSRWPARPRRSCGSKECSRQSQARSEADELLVEVAALSTDPAVHTAAMMIGLSRGDPTDPRSSHEAERAVEVSNRLGDVVFVESAAMDVLTGTYS